MDLNSTAGASAQTGKQKGGTANKQRGASTAGAGGESRESGHVGACDTCKHLAAYRDDRSDLKECVSPVKGRIRRVKCVRLSEDDLVCEACRRRSINCTNLRFGGARYKPREGRRIAAAAATFGRVEQVETSGAYYPRGTVQLPHGWSRPELDLYRDANPPTETSSEGRLGRAEDSAALTALLFDSYIEKSNFK